MLELWWAVAQALSCLGETPCLHHTNMPEHCPKYKVTSWLWKANCWLKSSPVSVAFAESVLGCLHGKVSKKVLARREDQSWSCWIHHGLLCVSALHVELQPCFKKRERKIKDKIFIIRQLKDQQKLQLTSLCPFTGINPPEKQELSWSSRWELWGERLLCRPALGVIGFSC